MKVRYLGYVGQPSGYGRAALDMCMALIRAGVSLEIRPLIPRGAQGVSLTGLPEDVRKRITRDEYLTEPDAIIVHDLPIDAVKVASIHASEHSAIDKPIICYTTWEGRTASTQITAGFFGAFDEVWVPSSANASAFHRLDGTWSGGVRTPNVRVMPHAFAEDSLASRRAPATGPGGPFRFYYIGAWNARKNPAGIIQAWAHAFTTADDVELVIQSAGASPESIAAAIGQTGLMPYEMAPIKSSITHCTAQEIEAMHRDAHCFVTAARGEAWNLPCFDAMLAGRMIIAPRGLGSDDYLTSTSYDQVPCRSAPAQVDVRTLRGEGGVFQFDRVGAQGLTSRDTWLEPDLTCLAGSMRGVVRNSISMIEVHYDPIGRYGYEAVGKLALDYLTDLVNRHGKR